MPFSYFCLCLFLWCLFWGRRRDCLLDPPPLSFSPPPPHPPTLPPPQKYPQPAHRLGVLNTKYPTVDHHLIFKHLVTPLRPCCVSRGHTCDGFFRLLSALSTHKSSSDYLISGTLVQAPHRGNPPFLFLYIHFHFFLLLRDVPSLLCLSAPVWKTLCEVKSRCELLLLLPLLRCPRCGARPATQCCNFVACDKRVYFDFKYLQPFAFDLEYNISFSSSHLHLQHAQHTPCFGRYTRCVP